MTISAIAAEEIPNLHTFVVGMKDESGEISDDIKASRMAAKHIGSTHHELLFRRRSTMMPCPL